MGEANFYYFTCLNTLPAVNSPYSVMAHHTDVAD